MQRRSFLASAVATALVSGAASHLTTLSAHAVPATVGPHPRLLITDFAAIRDRIAADDRLAGWYETFRNDAELLLDQPPREYVIPDGKRLLDTSREVLRRVHTLGIAHAVEGGTTYRDRLWVEMDAVCHFPDWNHQRHFLDVAEMSHAVALTYDWFHDQWTDEQRDVMKEALITFGLLRGKEVYEGEGQGSVPRWHTETHNWNIVCNGGMVVAALAVADEEPELAETIIDHALQSLPVALDEYAPDGGYPEGVSYWEYATKYLVLLIEALRTATGDARGLTTEPGLDRTGMFPIHLTGPTGNFNYYDSGGGSPHPTEMFWLAREYDLPVVGWWAARAADVEAPSWATTPLSLLWYDEALAIGPVAANEDKDATFGRCEVSTMRSAWESETAVFIAGKGGDNNTNHGDLDLGTVVLDALGVRWGVDLGSDDYNLPGYMARGANGARWGYYRKRAEGQNTLSVAPSEAADQDPLAKGRISRTGSGTREAFAVAELDDASVRFVRWRRGWRLFDHRRQVLVQDEYALTETSPLWWSWHTAATVSIAEDGRTATLEQSGQTMIASILAPAEATFLESPARPLWESPDPAGQNTNAGLRKLVIWLPEADQGTIAVQFSPVREGASAPPSEDVMPLAQWQVDENDIATLSGIQIGGAELPGFSPHNFTYDVPAGTGSVTATPSPGCHARVVSTRRDGVTRVVVTGAGKSRTTYEVWPVTAVGPGNFPHPVIASADDGNVPANTLDSDLTTRWSAEGDGQWIGYDLGSDGTVEEVRIAWYSGTARQSRFDIEIAAADETEWTTVYSGLSSGTSADLESYPIRPVTARYLRIVGHGNTVNQWNSIAEVDIVGRTVELPDRPPVLESITVAAPPLEIGEPAALTVNALLSDGTEADLSTMTVRFESSDPSVVSVDGNGTLTVLTAGSVRLSAVVVSDDHRLRWDSVEVSANEPGVHHLDAVADTYVNDGTSSDSNFGSSSTVNVKTDPSVNYNRIGYLMFETEPIAESIETITLNVHASISDSGGSEYPLSVTTLTEGFDEQTVTWSNRPELGAIIGEGVITDEKRWYQIDITDGLSDAVAAGGTVCVGLTHLLGEASRSLGTMVSSRETGNAAYLEVRTEV